MTRNNHVSEALDLESFAAHIEAATQQAGYEIKKRDGLDLYVVLHGQPMRCNLSTVYSAYQGAPHCLDDIIEAHLAALRSVPPTPPPPSEKEAAEALLPLLQSAEWLDKVRQLNTPPPVHRPFVGGLIITYVFDFPHLRAYLNQEKLAEIMDHPEFTTDMLHAYALENLRKRTTHRTYETHGHREKTIIACETRDGYAATRVLLPDLMEKWARRIPGRMLIGVPNRDFLIAFSDRDPTHVAAIARQVRLDAAQRAHPLCAELLVWQEGQVREYRPRH